jgi:hypothetical protein
MRATLPLADPAVILLDGRAMAGQPIPVRSRPIRPAFAGRRTQPVSSICRPRRPPAAAGPRRWDHDVIRVRDERIGQFDLATDDRLEAGFLGRRSEANDAVEALVVGDRECGQPEFDGPFHELIGRGCAVEEREVRVAVELRVPCHFQEG